MLLYTGSNVDCWFTTMIWYLSAALVWRNRLPQRWEKMTHSVQLRTRMRQNKGKEKQNTSVYTWKHRQPSSVIGEPNRITRQACILPSIFKCYIGQVENFYLLICSVNTCGLGEDKSRNVVQMKRRGSKTGVEEHQTTKQRRQVTEREGGRRENR